MSIMNHFPSLYKPRKSQRDVLLKIEKELPRNDVIVVNAPVAFGKSAISITLSKYLIRKGGSSIVVPNKLLVDQYEEEFGTQLHVMRGKSDYYCSVYKTSLSKRPKKKGMPTLCNKSEGCGGCTKYRRDLILSKSRKNLLSNFYTYMAHKMYRPYLIADEGHKMIDVLKDMATKTIWFDKWNIPYYVKTTQQFTKWANDKNNPWKRSGNLDFQNILEELNSRQPSFLFTVTTEKYHNQFAPCVKMQPVDMSGQVPFLWPSTVKKIIIMSATLSIKDIEQMGLGDRRVVFIEPDSPIPAVRRPVVLLDNMISMSHKSIETNLPRLVQHINDLGHHHDDSKGLVHLTYGLKDKVLKSGLLDADIKDRIMTHTASNKTKVYNKFRESEGNHILIGCGMEEGLDLKGPDFQWQVIGKVPWPSLIEPAIKYTLKKDPDLYAWNTAKLILQATGRICRGPQDYGITYVVDSSIKRLISENQSMFPKFFLDSIQSQ